MAFIRVQKKVVDKDGNIVGGCASLVRSVYVKGRKSHSRQEMIEPLGAVRYMKKSGGEGIFDSPTRGLVFYSLSENSFREPTEEERGKYCAGRRTPYVHTVFGDAYVLFEFLKNEGYIDLLRAVFPAKDSLLSVFLHLSHLLLKDGSSITCDNFIHKSFLSYLTEPIDYGRLRSDTAYYQSLGKDSVKVAFFKSLCELMRKKNKNFGSACYTDTTPLPNDIGGIPFNALCSHGVEATSVQTRLALVLDRDTGIPVWYTLIPGNVLDVSTIEQIRNDVESTLGITITDMVLDAGYPSRKMVESYPSKDDGSGNLSPETASYLARMPAKKGFPFREIYNAQKSKFGRGKYMLMRGAHTYFGCGCRAKVFGKDVWVNTYVDKENATECLHQFMSKNPEQYATMRDKDKDFLSVSGGLFMLMSNYTISPSEALDKYFGRESIEAFFKTSKNFLDLLPLSKWTAERIQGKILESFIAYPVYVSIRRRINAKGISMNEVLGSLESVMCLGKDDGTVSVDTPSAKARKYACEILGKDSKENAIPYTIRMSDIESVLFQM